MGDNRLTLTALVGIPRIRPGDDLAGLLIAALEGSALAPQRRDVLVVTQKVVSKAEGRYLELARLEPGPEAHEIAAATGKEPALVEAILSQSAEVLRAAPRVLIAATRHGLVLANAGIDRSNLEAGDDGRCVLLLPDDPDASARAIKARVDAHFRTDVGVVVSDSAGRAWRLGTVGLAIGAAGIPALLDRRGEADMAGRPLEVTEVGFADAIAAAAVLVMGEAAEARPAVLVRGLAWNAPARPASDMVRPRAEDLFR